MDRIKTVVLSVDPVHPQADVVAQAAAVIRAGGLVAFPTETVYGLGADALDERSVRRIFAAKGRPPNNPLIVHVTSVVEARRLTTAWPPTAELLTQRFWPGPLTIVLPKAAIVPDVTTAGGPTIALRMPAHPVARALIDAAGVPLAAPSANPSTRVSATRAEHVVRGLGGKIEMVLDGGPTPGGLESTVVDLSRPVPRLLRPGLVDAEALRTALGGDLVIDAAHAAEEGPALPSPGMLKKHYSPSVPLELADDDGAARVRRLAAAGERVGWVTCGEADAATSVLSGVAHVVLEPEPAAYARRLYDVLHALEERHVARIIVESPPATSAWAAIRDRLQRAAAAES